MNTILNQIKTSVYDKCSLEISEYKIELERKEYDACHFKLNGLTIFSRTAKTTPKKVGQFVTFYKRDTKESIIPFEEKDKIDFYVVNVQKNRNLGQFVFPKLILIQKGIISTEKKEGKRAFRVYPSWDIPNNKQATQTQHWQLDYFYTIDDATEHEKVTALYKKNLKYLHFKK